jgi:hypothetical protein
MLPSPQDFLNSFDVLPESQQRVIAAEIIRRTASWTYDPISDDALTALADGLFVELDQREAQLGESTAQ